MVIKKVIIIMAIFFLGGCATIAHGDSQYVEIDSVPTGASLYVGGNYFTTPAKVLLKRKHHIREYQIMVQKEGFKPGYAKIGRKLSGWLWGDIVWFVIPGVIVDVFSGAAFKLYPSQITVKLEKSAK